MAQKGRDHYHGSRLFTRRQDRHTSKHLQLVITVLHVREMQSQTARKKYQAKKIDCHSSAEHVASTGSIAEKEAFKIRMVKGCKLALFLHDTEQENNFLTCFLP